MTILKKDKSYIWVFFVFAAIWVALSLVLLPMRLIESKHLVFGLPGLFAILLIVQLVSGVALDSKWRATIVKGTWQFTGIIAMQVLVLLILCVMAYFQ